MPAQAAKPVPRRIPQGPEGQWYGVGIFSPIEQRRRCVSFSRGELLMEIVVVGVAGLVIYETARRKLDAWALQRAERIAQQEKAAAAAKHRRQEQLADLKQKLVLGAVVAGSTLLVVALLRHRIRGGVFSAPAPKALL